MVAVNVLVPARGHDITTEGNLVLGDSTIARVYTCANYFARNREAFEDALLDGTGGYVVMSGGYATLATGYRITPPNYEYREASLMAKLAVNYGIPDKHIHIITSPTSTLETVLRPFEEGYFHNIEPRNPLAIVTQESQWPRLQWFAQKVFELQPKSVVPIFAPGEIDQKIISDERMLLHLTRLVYGLAQKPRGLRRAEHISEVLACAVSKAGIRKPPANYYLELH